MSTLKRVLVTATLLLTVTFLAAISAGLGSGPVPTTPGKKSYCNDCHGGSGVAITVDVVGQTPAETTYSVSGSKGAYNGAVGWGVFDSSKTNIAHGYDSGTFTVPTDGRSYRVFWVNATRDGKGGSAYENITALPNLQVQELTTNQQGGIVIRWPSVPGRAYSIQYAELTEGTLEWHVADPDFPAGKGDFTTWTDDGTTTPSPPGDSRGRSYRIQINL
jgi:hypothetical protein